MTNLVFFLLSSFAAVAAERSPVYVFGGFGSTRTQIDCWLAGANADINAAHELHAYPYPSMHSDAPSAIRDGERLITQVRGEIAEKLRNTEGPPIFIVGHSSGAAVANRVAELLPVSARLRLIDLDGYVPSAKLRKDLAVKCWYAKKPGANLESRNAETIKAGCGTNARAFTNSNCDNAWCLHVSLFELNIPAKLNPHDLATLGRSNCSPNFVWLTSN